jgi:hypothetical protein
MRRHYQTRSNYARLRRNPKKKERWQSDFRGKIVLQDGACYFVGATLCTAWNGEQYLVIYLRPDMATFHAPKGAACL